MHLQSSSWNQDSRFSWKNPSDFLADKSLTFSRQCSVLILSSCLDGQIDCSLATSEHRHQDCVLFENLVLGKWWSRKYDCAWSLRSAESRQSIESQTGRVIFPLRHHLSSQRQTAWFV